MKTWIVLLLSCASLLGSELAGVTNRTGETVIPLNAGEDARGIISYGLFCVASASRAASNAPAGSSLFLILRNTGAKSVTMEGVTVDDFTLQDAQGKRLKLYLWNSPRTMGYGGETVVHLMVDRAAEAAQPWTLRFKTKPDAHVPFEITISDIKPGKK